MCIRDSLYSDSNKDLNNIHVISSYDEAKKYFKIFEENEILADKEKYMNPSYFREHVIFPILISSDNGVQYLLNSITKNNGEIEISVVKTSKKITTSANEKNIYLILIEIPKSEYNNENVYFNVEDK